MTLRIRYVKSGGFAGLIRGCTIDAAALAPAVAAVMKRLVKAALASGVGVAKAKAKTPGVADVPVHQLTIETDAGTVHLSFDDLALPKSLKPLVAFLTRRSKPM